MSSSSSSSASKLTALSTQLTSDTDAIDTFLSAFKTALEAQLTSDTDAIDTALNALSTQLTSDTDATDAFLSALDTKVTNNGTKATQNGTDIAGVLTAVNGLNTGLQSTTYLGKAINSYTATFTPITSKLSALKFTQGIANGLTSNVYASVFSIAGKSGQLDYLSVYDVGGYGNSEGVRIIADGVTVFDGRFIGTAGQGLLVLDGDTINFNTSLDVSVIQTTVANGSSIVTELEYKTF